MATLTGFWIPDFANTVAPVAGTTTGSLATGTSSGVITVGQRRLLHISAAVAPTSASRCVLSYTLGSSAGPNAPTPGAASPFFLGDEGWVIETGQYNQINLANIAAYNGAVTISYSVSILSKF